MSIISFLNFISFKILYCLAFARWLTQRNWRENIELKWFADNKKGIEENLIYFQKGLDLRVIFFTDE